MNLSKSAALCLCVLAAGCTCPSPKETTINAVGGGAMYALHGDPVSAGLDMVLNTASDAGRCKNRRPKGKYETATLSKEERIDGVLNCTFAFEDGETVTYEPVGQGGGCQSEIDVYR
jgi:hypothetical protein